MLQLNFEGWFQCRLATDPDPSDDPRGISGPTFAGPGEPDLDRIIRLQSPVALRAPFAAIGVNVRSVSVHGQPAPSHPLVGAQVELIDGAKFEGRNFIIAGTGREPIDPFHLQVSGNGITLSRQDLWDPNNPQLDLLHVSAALMARRQPTFDTLDAEVAEATGIVDIVKYRADRLALLESLYPNTHDPVKKALLWKRIDTLKKDNEGYAGITLFAQIVLTVKETWDFEINGPAVISDPEKRLGGLVGVTQTWPITFWMGGYDCDTMCAYMRGTLSIPLYTGPQYPHAELR